MNAMWRYVAEQGRYEFQRWGGDPAHLKDGWQPVSKPFGTGTGLALKLLEQFPKVWATLPSNFGHDREFLAIGREFDIFVAVKRLPKQEKEYYDASAAAPDKL